jgi:peroxiredoxin
VETPEEIMNKIFTVLVGMTLAVAVAMAAPGQVGTMAYEFSGLTGLDGKSYSLKDYRGKVILLMTVQWNCGGCNANAPAIGELAMKFQGSSFQAFGPDINRANARDLGTFEKNLKKTATQVNFPLLMGIIDSQIVSTDTGTRWINYGALRDVFFVIDHTGKIVHRTDGNRGNAMGATKATALEAALTAAIAAVPKVSIANGFGRQGLCLQACKRNGGYSFNLADAGKSKSGAIELKIMDNQGRTIRVVNWNSGNQALGGLHAEWDGMDSHGNPVAWGNYFLSANSPNQSVTLLLNWLP